MIKIVHISTSKNGGAGIAAFRIHEALNKTNQVESHFLQKDKNASNEDEKIDYVSVYKPSIIFRILRKLKLIDYTENSQLRKFVKTHSSNFEIATFPTSSYRIEEHPLVKEADIIHLHWVADFLNYPTFFSKINKPIMWTLHDMNPFQGIFHYKNDELNNSNDLGKIDEKIKNLKNKYIQRNKNVNILTLCKWMYENSISSKVFHKSKHFILPNLINFEQYPILDRKKEKQKLGLDNGLKTLLFIAQDINNPRKGFDLLIEALNKIKVRVNIITIGGEKKLLSNNYNHLHFKNINNVEKLNSLYSASDLTLLTSREDNLPNVMLESFANGTPVISFRTGGMQDWIKDNETGFLIDAFKIDELSTKLIFFIENDNIFDSSKIYEYAKSNFSIEKRLSEYISIYKNILSQ